MRLGLYRRLSELTNKVELEGFAAELIDRFGKLPREVNTLMLVVRIKAMCKRAGYIQAGCWAKRARQSSSITINSPRPRAWLILSTTKKVKAKVKDNKIVVMRDWTKERDKIQGAFSISPVTWR